MKRLIIVLAALLLVALPLIAACGDDDSGTDLSLSPSPSPTEPAGAMPTHTPSPSPTPTPMLTLPAVMAMLRDSVANAPEVTSYRFQIEATRIEDGEEITGLTTAGFTADGMHVRMVASDSPDGETINVGGKEYHRTGTSPWEANDSPSQCWTCSLSSEFAQTIDTVIGAVAVGEEEIRGVLTVHVKGRTDMAAKANQMWPNYDTADPEVRRFSEGPRKQFLAGTEHVDLWLGKEDNLIRQIRYQTSFPAIDDLEAYSFDATFSYWDYNVEMVIEAPAVP